jgi:putative DNA primase/helicase
MSAALDTVLARLKGVRREGAGFKALCPCHSENTGSLDVREGEQGVLMQCWGCGAKAEQICAAIGIEVRDLFFNSRNGHTTSGKGTSNPPLTLEAFAKRKGFTVEFLAEQGVAQSGSSITFKYLLMNGQRAPRQRVRTPTGFLWNKADGRPTVYGAWRIPEARKQGIADLYLVEGESDSLTLWAHDLAALGIPGDTLCDTLQAPHVRGFSRIYVVREWDAKGGEVFEKGCTARLANLEFRGAVRVIEMERAAVKDINDLHVKFLSQTGAFEAELALLVEMARAVDLPIIGLEAFDASSVQERKVEWLWRNRVALGKLTLFVGAPGLGKSFTALDFAARVSRDANWPDWGSNEIVGRTIVFSAEDGIEDTIIARLKAQNANLANVTVCKRIREMNESGEMTRRGFNLTRDLPHLERLIDQHPDTKVVIIDPVSAYAGRADTHKNAEMRTELLDPLSEMAERRGLAVIAITHWNKGGGNPLERVSGSIAFPAAARQVWGFTADPENPGRTLMLFGKSNLGPRVSGLAFRISEVDGRATLAWEAGDVDKRLDDVLRQERGETKDETGKLVQACELIRDMCADGREVPSKELEERAAKLGISTRTVYRARNDVLHCKARRKGGVAKDGDWWISLP